jgi:hypothetical protein
MSDKQDSGRRKTQLGTEPPVSGATPHQPPNPALKPGGGVQGYGGSGPAHAGGRRATVLEGGGGSPAAPGGRGPTVQEGPGAHPGSVRGSKRKHTVLDEGPGSAANVPQIGGTPLRRAVGWMISFDHNPVGQEYVIREGKTMVGNARDNDISLFNDNTVSSTHCIFISRPRGGIFTVVDKDSTAGTMVNGKDIGVGGRTDLMSGDFIKLGKTTFKLFLLDESDITMMWPASDDDS